MITATLNSDIFLVLYGNTSVTLSPENFTILKDGINVGNDGVINLLNAPSRLCAVEGSGTRNLTVTGYKHINSTSLQDDINNGHPNILSDDLALKSILDLIIELSGSWGSIEVKLPIVYYPASYPPNIDIARLRGVLKSTGSDYYSLFTNADINQYSEVVPDKLPPYSAGNIIGYCPNASGNYIMYKSPETMNVSWRDDQVPLTFSILRIGKVDVDILSMYMNVPLGHRQDIPLNYSNYTFTQQVIAVSGEYSGNLIANTPTGVKNIAPFSFTIIKEKMPLVFTNGTFEQPDRFTTNYTVTIQSTSVSEIQLFGKIRLHTSSGIMDWIPSGAGLMITVPPNSTDTYTYTFATPDISYNILELGIGNYGLVTKYFTDRIILSI